jgi:hypothetical protein
MRQPRTFIVLRLAIAVLGGYALSASLVAFSGLALSATSLLPRSEAVVLASMLGFVVYLCVFIWAIAEKRLALLGLAFALTIAVLAGGVYGLQFLVRGS